MRSQWSWTLGKVSLQFDGWWMVELAVDQVKLASRSKESTERMVLSTEKVLEREWLV